MSDIPQMPKLTERAKLRRDIIRQHFSPGVSATVVAKKTGIRIHAVLDEFRAMGWPVAKPGRVRGSKNGPRRTAASDDVARAYAAGIAEGRRLARQDMRVRINQALLDMAVAERAPSETVILGNSFGAGSLAEWPA